MRNLLNNHLCNTMQFSIVKALLILSVVQVFSILILGVPQKKSTSHKHPSAPIVCSYSNHTDSK
ncbi:unnamed protein product [Schistosoma turkestanicum]|nr:unnamed protein product [Schistosoma turkestanicum]